MNDRKYKCIKSYRRIGEQRPLFHKDSWYDVYGTFNYHIVRYGTAEYDVWCIPFDHFADHFATIDEVREIEIDKIINE